MRSFRRDMTSAAIDEKYERSHLLLRYQTRRHDNLRKISWYISKQFKYNS